MNRLRDFVEAIGCFCVLLLPVLYVVTVFGSFVLAAVMVARGSR